MGSRRRHFSERGVFPASNLAREKGGGELKTKIIFSLLSLLWLALVVSGSEAASPNDYSKINWSLLPRVSKLPDAQKDELFEVFKDEPNYGVCKDSIVDCLSAPKPDATAVRMKNFGAYLVSQGVPPRYLGGLVRERAKFANSKAFQSFTFEDTPLLGNEQAPITLVEFADFECSYCVGMVPLLEKLVEESNGKVRLFFKHFPLKSHPGSILASKAAQAAYMQGKFWEMYDFLFANLDKQSMEDILKFAQEIGLDLGKFKRDLEDKKTLQHIEKDKMEGVRAKVTATPTLFIDGKFNNFRHDEAFLKDIINDEAEHLKIKPPYKEWAYP
jgi:predicted DsbA family dithiol-disulfide isomerase